MSPQFIRNLQKKNSGLKSRYAEQSVFDFHLFNGKLLELQSQITKQKINYR